MPTDQYLVALKKPTETTRVFFHPSIIGGYGWVFPKQSAANVGVGIHSRGTGNLRSVLNRFAARLVEQGIIEPRILGVTGGYLPAGGLIRPWKEWVIMAGDAAGTCHPISGAGIYNALISGEMAGIAAAEALKENSMRPLRTYAMELASFLGPSLASAFVKRRKMVNHWQSADFMDLIKHNWIGQVTAQLESPGKKPVRLETIHGGRTVGEIAFFLGSRRTASVVVNQDAVVYSLSIDDLNQMEIKDPLFANLFHRLSVILLSQGVIHLTNTVRALERS